MVLCASTAPRCRRPASPGCRPPQWVPQCGSRGTPCPPCIQSPATTFDTGGRHGGTARSAHRCRGRPRRPPQPRCSPSPLAPRTASLPGPTTMPASCRVGRRRPHGGAALRPLPVTIPQRLDSGDRQRLLRLDLCALVHVWSEAHPDLGRREADLAPRDHVPDVRKGEGLLGLVTAQDHQPVLEHHGQQAGPERR